MKNRNAILFVVIMILALIAGTLAYYLGFGPEDSVPESGGTGESIEEYSEDTEGSEAETAESEEEVSPETGNESPEESEPEEEIPAPDSYTAGQRVSDEAAEKFGVSAFFTQSEISDDIFFRIDGRSFGPDCTTPRESLRYLRVLYYDYDGERRVGELICNEAISDDLLEIFGELYNNRYPVYQMRLVDDFDADDEWSCSENNTSCFNYRNVAGTDTLSNHAAGMAIDINPLENPYVKFDEEGNVTYCSPENGIDYVDRSISSPHMIDSSDLCTELFLEHGFTWGGIWNSPDYMHFEMTIQ